uniref:BPTI/Kunitz inhibitor domain-containing protein n=1 Tax=Chrysemys picta bellii TaxID=8478 RepID=A0A8C3IXX9_CHRPI
MTRLRCRLQTPAACPGIRRQFGGRSLTPPGNLCHLPSVCGYCKARFPRFFYNWSSQACEEFVYGGCGGNKNNFETKEECLQQQTKTLPNSQFRTPTPSPSPNQPGHSLRR